ncbi:hypothetical protein HRbin26_01748 [bacterium HR26]|nr:hypothetical protein HRbin26_01748 [bacterium HR26]
MHHHDGQQQRAFQVRIPLRTVTPLFLAGADPRGPAELRAASVRGALRFWLRALAGGCYGTDQAGLQQVRDLETSVFGAAGGQQGVGASKVVVSLAGQGLKTESWQPLGQGREPGSGIDYLYWSMGQLPVRGHRLPPKQYFSPDGRFTLTLATRPGVERTAARDAFYHAVRATWLLVHLGGVGARARRTAGSLGVEPERRRTPDGTIRVLPVRHLDLPFQLSPRPADAARELEAGLTLVRSRLEALPAVNLQRPDFEVLDPDWCKIWVFGGWQGRDAWMEAVDTVGSWLREIRGQLSTNERIVFGMPLVIPQQRTTIEPPPPYTKVERRMSPLWLTLTRTIDGSLLGVATLFMSRLLDARQEVPAERQLERHYEHIAGCVASLPNAVEVRYE